VDALLEPAEDRALESRPCYDFLCCNAFHFLNSMIKYQVCLPIYVNEEIFFVVTHGLCSRNLFLAINYENSTETDS
jgi:hypothetical protein